MRPMARANADPADVVRSVAADNAVELDPFEFALKVGFHAEELRTQTPHVHDERLGPVEPRIDRLVDDGVGVRRLLGLRRIARSRTSLVAPHPRIVEAATDPHVGQATSSGR